jgi:DNA-binding IclR family transcriptional regulator
VTLTDEHKDYYARSIFSTMPNEPKRIKTADNVATLLELLHEEQSADLAEIAANLGLAKSTTHSYLETLIDRGLVSKDDSEYRLSLKFLDYGGRLRDQTDLYTAAKPQLRDLHEETGHTIHLATREHNDLVLLERINPDETIGFGAHIGQRDQFHTPALGKAILAHLSEEEVDSIISKHGLVAVTEQSITSREQLEAELETIREQGYAVNDEEEHKNYKGVARPILLDGTVKGAISIAGPKTELEMSEETIHELLRSATDRIEIKIQYD